MLSVYFDRRIAEHRGAEAPTPSPSSFQISIASATRFEVTDDEALVLFEWLVRLEALAAPPYEHPAERQVVWEIVAQLERVLVEPLDPNQQLLEDARKRVDEAGGVG